MPVDTEFPKREPPPAPRPRQLTGRGVWAWFILFFGSVFAAK